MSEIMESTFRAKPGRRNSPWESWARGILFRNFRGIQDGEIVMRERGREHRFGHPAADLEPAIVEVRDPALYPAAVFGGSVGAGRAFMSGHWDSPDLTAVIRVLVRNAPFLERWRRGMGRLISPVQSLQRAWSRNTLVGSRRNIRAHYDLSNDFFSLFLDSRRMYSSAWFKEGVTDLDRAATDKLERICRTLALGPDDHVVEIGTGWGGFAEYAAREFGCRVTTTTISREQFEFARRRIADAGLEDRVEVLDTDYRELRGRFDALVSIEMIEAVGHEFFDTFFACCSGLLKPTGRMMLQAITIANGEFERAARSVDFIQHYIFPGSCLPSLQRIDESIDSVTDLRPEDRFELTASYAETLRLWRDRFLAHLPEVRKLGFDEQFIRMWEFYLCYCEAGFRERRIGTYQLHFSKPAATLPHVGA